MPCFHVLTLAFVLALVDYSQRVRAVTTCDFDLYVNKTGCNGPLVSSLSGLGAQEGGSFFSGGTEHLASPYCLKTNGGGGFFGAGSVEYRGGSDDNCTVYLVYAQTYESLDCAHAANGDILPVVYELGTLCSLWPLLGPPPPTGLPETAPWLLACVCSPDTVDSLIVWDTEFPSTSSPSSSASPVSTASSSFKALANDKTSSSASATSSSSSNAQAKARTSSSTPTPSNDNNLQEISNNLQAKSIKVQLGLGLGLGLPTFLLAFFTVRWFRG